MADPDSGSSGTGIQGAAPANTYLGRPRRRITEARFRLLGYAENHSLSELLERTIDEAELLSDSRIGFCHFVNDDQVNLSLQNWSTRTKAEYCTAAGQGSHYPISSAGVWVECVAKRAPVIHNDYASLANRKGLPEGHAQLVRELVVPVMRQGKVRAILGVGNKPGLYDAMDVEAVATLADLTWDITQNKINEEELADTHARLRALYEHMNQGVIFQRADGIITASNAAAQRMLGLSADDISGRTSMDPRWGSVHEDGSEFPGSEHPTMVALKTGQAVLDVTIGLHNPVEDKTRWFLVSAVPLFRSGETSAYESFVTLTDITEFKR